MYGIHFSTKEVVFLVIRKIWLQIKFTKNDFMIVLDFVSHNKIQLSESLMYQEFYVLYQKLTNVKEQKPNIIYICKHYRGDFYSQCHIWFCLLNFELCCLKFSPMYLEVLWAICHLWMCTIFESISLEFLLLQDINLSYKINNSQFTTNDCW